ncbi:MAG: phage tail protein, partial [Moraxella sp.]|nr:phage tail protein [Moraxella sp.]
GQKLASGSAAPNLPLKISQAGQADSYFGSGSMLSGMVTRFFDNHSYGDLWVMPLEDNKEGVAATGSLEITNAPSESGIISLYIGGQRLGIGVSSTDTPESIATHLASVINNTLTLPVTALINDAKKTQVDIIAKHKGECGNAIDLQVNYNTGEVLPKNLTIALSPMTGGAGNPDLSSLWSKLGDTHYHLCAFPYTDASNLRALSTELMSRADAMRQIEMMTFIAHNGTFGELSTVGNNQNCQYLSIMNASKS